MKSKLDAVLALMDEACRDTGTIRRMKRTEKALRILGLDDSEVGHVMCHLDYWITPDGNPFARYIEVSNG